VILPEDAGIGLTPHSAAKDASLRSRSGFPPAVSRRVLIFTRPDWSGLKASGGVSDHVPLVVTVALR
jgi:hypothetical protein